MKKLSLFVILGVLLFSTPIFAQAPTKICVPNSHGGCQDVDSGNPFPVLHTVSVGGFQANGGYGTLTSTASLRLVRLFLLVACYIKLGLQIMAQQKFLVHLLQVPQQALQTILKFLLILLLLGVWVASTMWLVLIKLVMVRVMLLY